jgi:hypothetical protein
MAYVIKQKRVQRVQRDEFRNEFPQLCAPVSTSAPLDFSGIKNIEFTDAPVAVKPVKVEQGPDYNALMCSVVRRMRMKWDQWNFERDIEYDYDDYDDGLYYDSTESEQESISAEDPEEWSD